MRIAEALKRLKQLLESQSRVATKQTEASKASGLFLR